MSPQPPQSPSLDERKFEQENADRKRELDIKEREVAAKEGELKRTRWGNPLVLALFAAAVGLIGNVFVARVNNTSTQELERLRGQSNLILEAIKTGSPDAACKNLLFFVNLNLIQDPVGAIHGQCATAPKGPPSLPALTAPPPSISSMTFTPPMGDPSEGMHVVVIDTITGRAIDRAEVMVRSGSGTRTQLSGADGRVLIPTPDFKFGQPLMVVSKSGYLSFQTTLPFAGGAGIEVSLVPVK